MEGPAAQGCALRLDGGHRLARESHRRCGGGRAAKGLLQRGIAWQKCMNGGLGTPIVRRQLPDCAVIVLTDHSRHADCLRPCPADPGRGAVCGAAAVGHWQVSVGSESFGDSNSSPAQRPPSDGHSEGGDCKRRSLRAAGVLFGKSKHSCSDGLALSGAQVLRGLQGEGEAAPPLLSETAAV